MRAFRVPARGYQSNLLATWEIRPKKPNEGHSEAAGEMYARIYKAVNAF
jgi:hypothetical protein